MNPSTIQIVATVLFALAVMHTFLVKKFEAMAHHYPEGSMGANFFHYLSEVEAVFGIWAALFIMIYSALLGFTIYDESHNLIGGAVHFLDNINFTEPAFVFVIMCMAGTKPVILTAEKIILLASKVIPLPKKMAFYISALVIGPLLGSFITEPAAMTVTALILLENFYKHEMSDKFKYATIGLLFVNISIGGTLTHFAAPPVLMVAGKWHWDMAYMFTHFGFKALFAVLISAVGAAFIFKNELKGEMVIKVKKGKKDQPPVWLVLAHTAFLALVVYTAHHMAFFLALFLFFVGFTVVTKEYQEPLKIKESLLVGFFLGGLVVLGNLQDWWLKDVLTSMGDLALYFGATALTAFTDNAALTYLGSLVELSDSAKYNLVAGAVTGGGLTVIANAPNPAGFGILKSSFGEAGINPMKLFLGALVPTIVAIICFQLLPSFGGAAH